MAVFHCTARDAGRKETGRYQWKEDNIDSNINHNKLLTFILGYAVITHPLFRQYHYWSNKTISGLKDDQRMIC